ncbi:MAG: hypothetical protein ABI204_06525 [Ginsengibacter sp.]
MQKTTDTFDFSTTVNKQPGKSTIQFAAGNILVIDEYNNELKLFSKDQVVQLVINIQEKGLIVNLIATELNICSTNELNLSSKKINIEASEQINIKTAGNLVQEVKKDLLTEVGGTNKQIAQIQKITATLGNAEIKANDYVKLDGESVLLNCEE